MKKKKSATNCGSVQSFYERMPYPPPLATLDQIELLASTERRRIRSLLMFPENEPRRQQTILVAGCGTSQAAKVALREPDSRVVAIDISATSLAHLRGLQKKYSLSNLETRQLSLLDVADLSETFDQIICTGVLHHLPDPVAGLRSLRGVLKPDGAMQVMVYANYGRTGIYMMQEYCRLLGIDPSHESLNDLSTALKFLPDDHPLNTLLHKARDFQHADALADALLHPQDRAYTVPQIYDWLARCGMSFGRWLEQAPYLPQCGSIARTPHAARISKLPNPAQHAAVELFRGTIIQHAFIAYRSDRSRPAQPIQFADEEWRKYVPVRLPWTTIVHERIPAGSAGVFLNALHKSTDLYLPIDATENDLIARIDGDRSLGEIASNRATETDSLRVRSFFERLWQHDLVAIDASQIFHSPCLTQHRSYDDVSATKRDVTTRQLSSEVLVSQQVGVR